MKTEYHLLCEDRESVLTNGTCGIRRGHQASKEPKRGKNQVALSSIASLIYDLLTKGTRYNLSDCLAVAAWLNVFVRQSKHVGMANIAQSVNVISPLMTTKSGIYKQTTWWPLLLFSKYMRGSTVAVNVCSGEYTGQTKPAWIRGTIATPWLDVSAALDDNGVLNLAVVNIHEEKDFKTDLFGIGEEKDVEVYTVTGANTSVSNTDQTEEIHIEETKWKATSAFVFPKHSFTLLRWKV